MDVIPCTVKLPVKKGEVKSFISEVKLMRLMDDITENRMGFD